ncbi:MAG: DUF998 domain-containing protein [Streptosporangiaceae bacterium]
MTQPARPDPARTPARNDHGRRPGPPPSGAARPARRAVGILAFHPGIRAWPGQPDPPGRPGQPGRLAELRLAGTARRHVRRLAGSATWPPRPRALVPGWTVVSAALAPVVVTAGWLVADAVQPAAYNPIRMTVSVMSGYAGTDRWIMTGALLLVGGCQLLTAAGLAGAGGPARILLAVAGLSSIGIAVSPEPVRGSTPQHLAWTALGAVAIAVWPAFVARRAPPRPPILGRFGRAVVTAVFVVLLGWLVIETQGGSDLGLAERLSVSTETCWPFVVAVALRQATRPCPDPGHPVIAAIRSRYDAAPERR